MLSHVARSSNFLHVARGFSEEDDEEEPASPQAPVEETNFARALELRGPTLTKCALGFWSIRLSRLEGNQQESHKMNRGVPYFDTCPDQEALAFLSQVPAT